MNPTCLYVQDDTSSFIRNADPLSEPFLTTVTQLKEYPA